MSETDTESGKNLTPLERARQNPGSKAWAIKAMCFQCFGSGSDSGWKWGVGNCAVNDCALHPHRPYQHLAGKPPQGVYKKLSPADEAADDDAAA